MTELLQDDQVRAYMAELDASLKSLSAADAIWLRCQIVSHLDEALGSGATEEEVSDALRRLGAPVDLVVEHLASPDMVAKGLEAQRAAKARKRLRLRRLTILMVIMAVIAGVAGFAYSVDHADAPTFRGGGWSWWYKIDAIHSYATSANGMEQLDAPVRVGQRQGIVIQIYNPSRWTQTILGAASADMDVETRSVTVQIAPFSHGIQPPMASADYRSQASIPPHQWAYLRLSWTTGDCDARDTTDVIGGVDVRVRVGWFTHNEAIDFNTVSFGLATPANAPARLHCNMNPSA